MIWISIGEVSLLGSLLIFIVMILRKLSKNKASYAAIILLWELVLARLLVPLAFSSTITPLGNLIETQKVQKTESMMSELTWGKEEKSGLQSMNQNLVLNQNRNQTLKRILDTIWASGALVALTLCGIWISKSNRIIKEALPIKEDEWMKECLKDERRKIKILVSDRISTPMTVGSLRPKIILPKSMNASRLELTYILTHEKIHIHNRHILLKRIAILAVCIHWFNPLVYVMYSLICKDLELACDEQVVRIVGSENRDTYAVSLINLAESKSHLMTLENSFGKNHVEERVIAIMKKHTRSTIITGIVVGVGLFSASISAMSVQYKKPQVPTNEYNQTIHIVEDEKERNKDGLQLGWENDYEKYGMFYDQETDTFTYKGEKVKMFFDEISVEDDQYRMFSRPIEGIIVEAVRDSNNKLMGLKKLESDIYFNSLEDTDEDIYKDTHKADSDYAEKNPKADYKQYGITYNEEKEAWEMNGRIIMFLIDDGHHWHVNNSAEAVKSGLKLKVERDKKGTITGIKELTDKEFEDIKKNNEFAKIAF